MTKLNVKITIKKWFTGEVLFESEKDTIKEALQDAVLRGAVLQGADLRGAVLRGAVLRGADLRGAVLRGADLQGADLRGAVLRGAVLQGADLRGAVLRGADLQGADLRGADLQDADLRGIPMENLPKAYIDTCSKDILYILYTLRSEVPYLKQKLIAGEVDGSQYAGECACLVGSLAKANNSTADEEDVDKLCSVIPFYEKGTHNPGEQWFLSISEGDTPDDNAFSKHAVELCNMVLGLPLNDGLEEKADEIVEIQGKKYRKADVEDRLKELETI